MRNMLAKTLVTGLLVAVPSMMLATSASAGVVAKQAATQKSQASSKAQGTSGKASASTASKAKSSAAATHSASGVVKSVSDTSLVISHNKGKKPEELSFTMDPSTQKEGNVEVGQKVSVRYRNEGSMHVATAVKAQAAKSASARKSK